jgi:hypothetical protein
MQRPYFAWADPGEAFDPAVHNRYDVVIYSYELTHRENDFPGLTLEIQNPYVGLLAPGRKVWCWFSWQDNAGTIHPLFNGRLVAIPRDLFKEIVTVDFIAKPPDYDAQKTTLADSLKVLPYYDRLWASQGSATPNSADAVLEARTQLWHIGRTDLVVSVSDIIEGEDGTILFGESGHDYQNMSVTYGQPPLKTVNMKATSGHTQAGRGAVDITQRIYSAFDDVGSGLGFPAIASLTGDGLYNDWPKPGTSIGDGWSVSSITKITPASFDPDSRFTPYAADYGMISPNAVIQPTTLHVDFNAQLPPDPTQPNNTLAQNMFIASGWDSFGVDFSLWAYFINPFVVEYTASRPRTETLTFSVTADLQAIVTDPAGADVTTIELNTTQAGDPIDPDGALPIGDLRRRSFFLTDRGGLSYQHLLLRCVAQIAARARCVIIEFEAPFAAGIDLSCRKNVQVGDRRVPGGTATGKVIEYSLLQDDQGQRCRVTIGCTVGKNGSVTTIPGVPSYVSAGYVSAGYQKTTGAMVQIPGAQLTYQPLTDFTIADDGIDLFNMGADSAVLACWVDNGLKAQGEAVLTGAMIFGGTSDPVGALKAKVTKVNLMLADLTAQFSTTLSPTIGTLYLPRTIDLEAS